MAFDFPTAPSLGQVYAPGTGKPTYTWDGEKWASGGSFANFPDAPINGTTYGRKDAAWNAALPLTGGTLSGQLSLPTGPAAANAVRKDYVDSADSVLQTNINGKINSVNGTATGGFGVTNSPGQPAVSSLSGVSAACSFNMQAPPGYARTIIAVSAAGSFPARWIMNVGNAAAETGGNTGSDFSLVAFDDAGNGLFTPIGINRKDGTLQTKEISNNGPYNQYNSWAGKTGGGPFGDNSDARIKSVVGPYTSGLAQIIQLDPVRYSFIGNDTPGPPTNANWHLAGEPPPVEVPYPNSPHYSAVKAGEEFVGLVAQDVESIMPEMVEQKAFYIDGEAVSDLRTLDTAPLTFALINAVKELKAEIDKLKAASP